ncbi:MAG: sulfatase [Planctomycetota bacterium]
MLSTFALVCACGEPPPAYEAHVDLTGRLTCALPPLAQPELLASLAAVDGGATEASAAPWSAEAPIQVRQQGVYSSEVRSADAPLVPATLLLGRGRRTVAVALSALDPDDRGNAVRALVGAYIGQYATLKARWLARGQTVATSRELRLECRGAPRQVVLRRPTPAAPLDAERPDTLLLEFDGPCDAVAVCRVDLLRSRPGDDLPEAQSLARPHGAQPPGPAPGARLISLGTEQRRGVGLIRGRELEVEATAGPRATLELSYGWPLGAATTGSQLVVRWGAPDGPTSTSKIPLDPASAGGWRHASIELGLDAPGKQRLTFALESPEVDAVMLLADVRLERAEAAPRTVVLVTSDTHRGDHLGLGGAARVATPHLDALGRGGVVFLDAFASTNVTNPSHAALMTGLHPRDLRIVDNNTALGARAETLAERFRGAGFRTFAAVSAQHLEPRQSGLGQGFQRFDAPPTIKRPGRETLDIAERWLDEAEGQPVFLWLHLFDPHAPYTAPPLRAPAGRPAPLPGLALEIPVALRASWMDEGAQRDAEGVRALYRAEVETVDELIGRLRRRARVEAGTFVFTADHGEALGDNDVWFTHAGVRRATLHVPLIIRAPGLEGWSGTTRARVRQIDVGRTLLRAAGLETRSFPGRDLAWAFEAPERGNPRFALSAHGDSAALESQGWLAVLHLARNQRSGEARAREHGEVELYDLSRDALGLENVLERELPRATLMRAALIKWLQNAPPVGLGEGVTLDASTEANLAALGYSVGRSKGASSGSEPWWRPDATSPWVTRFER